MIRAAVSAVFLFSAVAAAEDAALEKPALEKPASEKPALERALPDPALVELAVPAEGDPFAISETGRLSVAVKHGFARPEAVNRLMYLLAYWKKRFNIESEWRGDRVFLSGAVYGIKIQAMFAINDSSVVGFAHDPGWPWRGQVQTYVDRKLRKYLDLNYDDPQ